MQKEMVPEKVGNMVKRSYYQLCNTCTSNSDALVTKLPKLVTFQNYFNFTVTSKFECDLDSKLIWVYILSD